MLAVGHFMLLVAAWREATRTYYSSSTILPLEHTVASEDCCTKHRMEKNIFDVYPF